jgi:hypothetical protein
MMETYPIFSRIQLLILTFTHFYRNLQEIGHPSEETQDLVALMGFFLNLGEQQANLEMLKSAVRI